ncbi:MAG: aldo/keto reductase [Proteobacteria bacterium]|nr:aldo/keto reductase [Pseudomonadota bacterium]
MSEIGFGAWGIGGRTVNTTSYGETDDATSLAALRRALECGITFFDTSVAYGDGHSEELIGRAFAADRAKVVIATKAGYVSWERPPDFSPDAIVRSAEGSLKRMGTDYLDLFQLHNPPIGVLRSEAVQAALQKLRKAGKVRAWGISAKSPADALEALDAVSPDAIQANFNMMDVRAVESGLLESAGRQGVGFIGRTPLCFGFLSGTIHRDSQFPPGDHRLGWSRQQLDTWIDGAADLLAAVPARPGSEGAQSALRFCLSFAELSCTIPGILTPAEAEANAQAAELGPLPAAAVAAVMAINRERRFFVAPARPT